MNKLEWIVGLKGVGESAENPARYFVNDLAGIGGELLENLTGREAADLSEVWAKVKRRAKTRLLDQAELKIADLYSWDKSVYRSEAPRPVAGGLDLPDLATSAGVFVYVPDAQRLDIAIDAVSFVLLGEDGGLVEVLFLDAGTGQPLTLLGAEGQPLGPFIFQASPGLNEVPVGGMLATPLANAEFYVGVKGTSLGEAAFDLFGAGLGSLLLDQPTDVGLSAAAQAGGGLVPVITGHWTAGVSVDLRVDCSLDKAIARNTIPWATCWLYLLGAEIMTEKIQSPRTNYWASGNLALSEENRDALEKQFQASLARIVKRLDLSDLCASCDSQAGVSYSTDQRP